jgi:hypothetical protein
VVEKKKINKNLKIFIWKLKINMDDSHEVIINTTPSRDIEGDQDSTFRNNNLHGSFEVAIGWSIKI